MATTAADARQTSSAARHPTRAGVLPAGAAADAGNTTLATGATARATVLSAGAAGTVGLTAGTARILLENYVSRRCADRTSACLSGRYRHYSHRRGNGTTNENRFQHTEYGHVEIFTLSTCVQNIEFQWC